MNSYLISNCTSKLKKNKYAKPNVFDKFLAAFTVDNGAKFNIHSPSTPFTFKKK
jgi:hypothetical protein